MLLPSKIRTRRLVALASTALAALVLASSASAGSREPMSEALASLHSSGAASHSGVRPDPRALRALDSAGAQRVEVGEEEVKISSGSYGAEQMAPVVSVLRGLDHGSELARLSVYLATPTEIEAVCGATVIACYVPSKMEMVVSGDDRSIAGVPRDFAIAHEYGHHIANSQRADAQSPLEAGTIRWATYERVCQFTRARKLYPGDQGVHYWENPEEAFAQSYAHLSEPAERVSWQYTPLLRPTTPSLAKIRADIMRPWSGPVAETWKDTVTEPPATKSRALFRGSSRAGLAGATAVGELPWTASRLVRTPLDGEVTVHLEASAEAEYAVLLRDSETGRVLSRATTGSIGGADISYANCGRSSLRLEVRSLHGAGTFEATVARP